jgi:hypothetical protein
MSLVAVGIKVRQAVKALGLRVDGCICDAPIVNLQFYLAHRKIAELHSGHLEKFGCL